MKKIKKQSGRVASIKGQKRRTPLTRKSRTKVKENLHPREKKTKKTMKGGLKEVKPRFQFSSPIEGMVSLLAISSGISRSTTIVRRQQFIWFHFWEERRAV